jgi:NAD(P)-dependent dehydrogenase (short-subunit alcohol dehydrogenase family)
MAGAIVIGAGPGIGAAVARRLAGEGLAVGVIARTRETLDGVMASLDGAHAQTADVTDEAGLRAALDALVDQTGVPEVLVYNAALIQSDPFGELTARQQLDAYAVNVVGAITAIAHLAPRMAGGTIIITSGMREAIPEVTSLSLGKAAVRALVDLVGKRYQHLHVASVTVTGAVAPGTAFDPDVIAGHYWALHTQPRGAWEREAVVIPSG